MTVPRINALIDYWRDKCPPACRALAAFIGFKPKQAAPETAQSQEDAIEELMSMFPMRPPQPLPLAKPGA